MRKTRVKGIITEPTFLTEIKSKGVPPFASVLSTSVQADYEMFLGAPESCASACTYTYAHRAS